MKTIRIGIIGNVDSGKSTLTGLLTKTREGVYDDGKGYCRSLIFNHKHELLTGRTSSVTRQSIKTKDMIIDFIDLAGHETYLKTTIKGLCGYYIDYVFLIIGANMGVSKMTLEHLLLAKALNIPTIIIITKIDLAPVEVLNETIDSIKRILKKYKSITHEVKSDSDLDLNIIKMFLDGQQPRISPIFLISNKTGSNIPLLKSFIQKLDPVQKFDHQSPETKFIIHATYNPTGIGLVIAGILYSGSIKKNDILYLGPFYNKFVKIQIRTFLLKLKFAQFFKKSHLLC